MFGATTAGGAWMETLNAAQREAVTHGAGPLLVVAGAGSGKTWTLACRVAYLVEQGVAPERILLLTFTRRAAREMLERAGGLLAGGPAQVGKVWGGTFHAVANRLLRLYARPLGIQPYFTVLDQADTADLLNLIRGDLGFGQGKHRFPRKETLAAIYSRTVNSATKLGSVLERHFPWCAEETDGIRAIFEAYTTRKREQNLLDYDDLLLYWGALARAPRLGETVAGLFEHILVDEYQDTNALQGDLLRHLRPGEAPNITVVGDDAQAIYSFRAATNRNILDFPQHFPGTMIVKLEQNYRSTQPILAASNAVIALSKQRHEKTLWSSRRSEQKPLLVSCLDEAAQCDAVCRHVLEQRERGVPLRRQAVLFRASHHGDLLEVELAKRNIPFVKYGGLKFLEAAHVKDVLAILRLLENPHDEVSWFRVLQLLDGIGPASARQAMQALGVRRTADGPGGENTSPLKRLLAAPPLMPAAARHEFDQLRATVADCLGHGEQAPPPTAQVERIRRFCEPIFARVYSSAPSRLRDVEQLEAMAAGYPSRGRFVSELTLDPPQSTGDLAGPPLLDEDYLVLSTIHSAKGCEWDVVHVIHAADGMIPSDMATGDEEEIEEERRLLYVALTRARDLLCVYFPLRYYHARGPRGASDAHNYTQLTRFLPESARRLFERRNAFGVADEAEAGDVAANGRAGRAVETFLRDLWQA